MGRLSFMSKICDPARSLQGAQSSAAGDSSDARAEMGLPERRVSPRQELDVNLAVYGRSAYGAPFYDRATAIEGNAGGGLIVIPVPLTEGQDLLLINTSTSHEQICTVVRVHIRDVQMSEVTVRFPRPNPAFWQTPPATSHKG